MIFSRQSLSILLLISTKVRAFVSPSIRPAQCSQRLDDIATWIRPTSTCRLVTPPHSDSDSSSLQQAFERVAQNYQNLSVGDIQRQLVQQGARFEQEQAARDEEPDPARLASSLQRVPACISNLHIQTILTWDNSLSNYRVSLRGTSDSLLSRGLLAVVATSLEGAVVNQVLQLEADSVADAWNLRQALSRGRNDGLAGLLRTVQTQIQELLDAESSDIQQSSITEPSSSVESSQPKEPTAALLLSGGVDSSVALHLLKRQGYNVTAFYLKIWLEDELAHLGSHCPFEDDILLCQAVCDQAGVPLEQVSLQQEYQDRVISYTLQEARQGRTPNPDIMCNSRIKFGCFYDAIASRGFDHVATGHYAQLVRDENTNQMRLLRAPDPVKDQSYFLCALTQEQLQRVLFPIGHLQKSEVRQLADEFQLPNRHRPDSQGLCFLGKVKFDEFIKSYLGERPGDILDAATGELLGQHRGVWYHTVGQRKGIGKVLNPLATSRGPWYVVAKDPERNIVFCSNEYDDSVFEAARSQFTVENIQWFAESAPALDGRGQCRLTMKIRHGPRLVQGTLTLDDDKASGRVCLDNKDGGLAPGQFVVFYQDEECLGGGVISERHWAQFLLDQSPGTDASTTSINSALLSR